MPSLKVGEINMYYEIHGTGHPLVMIMGGSGNVATWSPYIVKEFSKQFKTLIFDNRGAGQTDAPAIEYTIRMMADDTAALMDALDIDHSHVLGWSMGGMIAQELALNYPNKVNKIVMFGTYADGGSHSDPPSEAAMQKIRNRRELSDEERLKSSLDLYLGESFKKSNPEGLEEIYQMLSHYWKKAPTRLENTMRQVRAIAAHDAYDRLPQIKNPTLIIAGEEDILQTVKNHEILAERIPSSKLVVLEGVGHAIMLEVPEVFTNTAIDFLKQ